MASLSLRPVPFTAVRFDDRFWAPVQEVNRTRSIPANEAQIRATGRLDALRLDWKPGRPNEPHIFWESDIGKWIEAASCSFATHPDPELDRRLDEVIALLAAAQQSDGYLNSHFTVVRPQERWKHFNDHELYCAGHLIEGGVAHHAATGKRSLLEVCLRLADCLDRVFGPGPDQRHGYCGHEEIELALMRLHHATGEARYLALARYMIDQRGTEPHYFDTLKAGAADDWVYRSHFAKDRYRYYQAHLPVREQTEVVGHAVRATYLYCAMADVAAADGDARLAAAGRRLWRHATRNLMYVTGGIGSSRENEGFTFDRDLPNESAYCETCAAIGLVLWAQRLFLQERKSEYIDVLERALYNNVLAGMSRDGTRFFYENPLASLGGHHRQEWFSCSCCPPNLSRLLAGLGGLVYATGPRSLHVNLYAGGEAAMVVAGTALRLVQRTGHPWDGRIRLALDPAAPCRFALHLRRPGWCRTATLRLNGRPLRARESRGYLVIDRLWGPGDVVELDLAMPVELVRADPRIRQDAGRVALQRGPLVWCLESCDNDGDLDSVVVADDVRASFRFRKDLLGGIGTLRLPAERELPFPDQPYATAPPLRKRCSLTAVPYFAWDNRAPGAMAVWMRTDAITRRPARPRPTAPARPRSAGR